MGIGTMENLSLVILISFVSTVAIADLTVHRIPNVLASPVKDITVCTASDSVGAGPRCKKTDNG